jgi:hypothetical protein
MLEIILDLILNPVMAVLDLVGLLLERRFLGEKSKMYPLEDLGPVTEEEILRDRLEERTRSRNQQL